MADPLRHKRLTAHLILLADLERRIRGRWLDHATATTLAFLATRYMEILTANLLDELRPPAILPLCDFDRRAFLWMIAAKPLAVVVLVARAPALSRLLSAKKGCGVEYLAATLIGILELLERQSNVLDAAFNRKQALLAAHRNNPNAYLAAGERDDIARLHSVGMANVESIEGSFNTTYAAVVALIAAWVDATKPLDGAAKIDPVILNVGFERAKGGPPMSWKARPCSSAL